jgi:hypothetical protein
MAAPLRPSHLITGRAATVRNSDVLLTTIRPTDFPDEPCDHAINPIALASIAKGAKDEIEPHIL